VNKILPYVAALIVYVACDYSWLTLTGDGLYRAELGGMLLDEPVVWAAIVFYLLYTAGLMVFAVLPALRAGSLTHALLLGGFFGAVAYATYDLTNQATMRGWSTKVTVADIAWGFVVSAIVSAVGYGVGRWRAAAS
jgi:uncharacterized membrane protein